MTGEKNCKCFFPLQNVMITIIISFFHIVTVLDHIAEAVGWLAECDKLFHSCSHHPRKLDSNGSLPPHQEGSQVDVLILQ